MRRSINEKPQVVPFRGPSQCMTASLLTHASAICLTRPGLSHSHGHTQPLQLPRCDCALLNAAPDHTSRHHSGALFPRMPPESLHAQKVKCSYARKLSVTALLFAASVALLATRLLMGWHAGLSVLLFDCCAWYHTPSVGILLLEGFACSRGQASVRFSAARGCAPPHCLDAPCQDASHGRAHCPGIPGQHLERLGASAGLSQCAPEPRAAARLSGSPAYGPPSCAGRRGFPPLPDPAARVYQQLSPRCTATSAALPGYALSCTLLPLCHVRILPPHVGTLKPDGIVSCPHG